MPFAIRRHVHSPCLAASKNGFDECKRSLATLASISFMIPFRAFWKKSKRCRVDPWEMLGVFAISRILLREWEQFSTTYLCYLFIYVVDRRLGWGKFSTTPRISLNAPCHSNIYLIRRLPKSFYIIFNDSIVIISLETQNFEQTGCSIFLSVVKFAGQTFVL